MWSIREQLQQPPRALLQNMQILSLDQFQPIEDKEPDVTARVRGMLERNAAGEFREEDYTPKMWKVVSALRPTIQKSMAEFGRLQFLTLVERAESEGQRTYRYRMDFEKVTLLQYLAFDEKNRLAEGVTNDEAWKTNSNTK
jgi:hypothetical protein